jgi:O-antigen biosynthesis protein
MKIFGIGLPRTGTTSMALATMELGFKTCHARITQSMYDKAEAFFDTPICADYQQLDARYPGAKFILTWRDPDQWVTSFSKTLQHYLNTLRTTQERPMARRAYLSVFGHAPSTRESLLESYHTHRQQAEAHFAPRPHDFLLLEIDKQENPWDRLCPFLGVAAPSSPFPRLNSGARLNQWEKLIHPNKIA